MLKVVLLYFVCAIGLMLPAVQAGIVIAPNSNAATPGNAQGPAPLRFYGVGGSRVQQVYSSSFFGNDPISINSISFRPFTTGGLFFGDTVTASDSIVQLSTTSFGDETGSMLNTNFASNIGSDVQTVYSGILSLTTDFSPGAGNTLAFTYTLNLMSPFQYNPSLGNLLLDVNIPSSATVSGTGIFGFVTFDSVNNLNDGIASIVAINNGSATDGIYSTAGAITSFEFSAVPAIAAVPEPTSFILFGGLVGLMLTARRSRNK